MLTFKSCNPSLLKEAFSYTSGWTITTRKIKSRVIKVHKIANQVYQYLLIKKTKSMNTIYKTQTYIFQNLKIFKIHFFFWRLFLPQGEENIYFVQKFWKQVKKNTSEYKGSFAVHNIDRFHHTLSKLTLILKETPGKKINSFSRLEVGICQSIICPFFLAVSLRYIMYMNSTEFRQKSEQKQTNNNIVSCHTSTWSLIKIKKTLSKSEKQIYSSEQFVKQKAQLRKGTSGCLVRI